MTVAIYMRYPSRNVWQLSSRTNAYVNIGRLYISCKTSIFKENKFIYTALYKIIRLLPVVYLKLFRSYQLLLIPVFYQL